MIYANRTFKATDREMDWGTLHQITMGEHGRGRKLVALTCPADIEEITVGLHKDLTIGSTKSGNPRIIKASDDKLCMILSAEGRYTRRGNGTIQVLRSDMDKYSVLRRVMAQMEMRAALGTGIVWWSRLPGTTELLK